MYETPEILIGLKFSTHDIYILQTQETKIM